MTVIFRTRLRSGMAYVHAAFVVGMASSCLVPAAAAQTGIDTTTAWDNTSSITGWGYPYGSTATIGQVIVAPSDVVALQSFSVSLKKFIMSAANAEYRAYVYEWDTANSRITGPALFASQAMTATSSASDFAETTIDTGGVALQPGKQYVLFLSTSTETTQGGNSYEVGSLSDSAYADGSAFTNDNGIDFSLLSTTSWTDEGVDLAFVALFLDALSGAKTPDQLAVQNALNSGFSDTSVFTALAALSDGERRAAYNQIAGQLHSSGPTIASHAAVSFIQYLLSGNASFSFGGGVNATGFARESYALAPAEAMAAGMAGVDDNTLAVPSAWSNVALFAGVHGDHTEVDGDNSAAAWSSHSVGFVAGAELRLDRLLPASNAVVGIGGGFTATSASGTGTGQSLDVGSWQVGIYGRAGASPIESGFGVNGGVSYGHQSYDSKRDISFAGLTANTDYNGDSVSGIGELRYGFDLSRGSGRAFVVAPTIGADGTISHHDGFTETGAGALNLSSGSDTYEQGNARIGLRVASAFSAGSVVIAPQLGLFYERAFGDVTPTASMTLAGSTTPIAVQGPNESRDRAHLQAGLNASLNSHATLQLTGDTVLSEDRTTFAGSGRLKFSF